MPESPSTIGEPFAPTTRWKHGSLPVIGLTGAVGGGKSAAAALLRERGAVVIDADAVGHEVLRRPEIAQRLADRFGSGILTADQTVDRRALGRIVFADPAGRRDLEAVVHPPMFEEFQRIVAESERCGEGPMIVLDAAILLESGWDHACDLVVFVDAPKEVRLDRVRRSRGWSAEELDAREAAQWPVERKKARADRVLVNDDDLAKLTLSVDRLIAWIDQVETVPPQ
ncbi:dephospho-CoA kinase [Paludisphaera rhizosphaerae]|uniref:dephospho-CoA kinase n=1 Tax=Paludisphaera rhizosphaerae TaxID=2711216 RepID=UPI0013EDDE4A|nr:dephospho-CoA kinase [Paludisphaera rhizosphaerae]